MLRRTEGKRRREWHRTGWLGSITSSVDTNLGNLLGIARDREAWCAAVHGVAESRTRLSN